MISRNLEVFLKIAEYGSITKAAKALYITQPAASNAVAKLETELGVKLFYRDKRNGLLLTEIGQKILSLAKQMDDIDNRMKQAAYEEQNILSGRVRIAALSSLVSTVLSKALREYRRKYPNIKTEIIENSPDGIYKAVEEHAVDFAVTCSPFGKFDRIVLRNDKIIAALPKGRGKHDEISLSSPPDVLVINRPAFETIMEYLPQKGGIAEKKLLLVQNAETALNLVSDGNGIGIISEYTLDTLSRGTFDKFKVTPLIAFEIGLLANDFSDLSPAAAQFVKIIGENNSTLQDRVYKRSHEKFRPF